MGKKKFISSGLPSRVHEQEMRAGYSTASRRKSLSLHTCVLVTG